MSDLNALEMGAALADLVALAEKNAVTFPEIVEQLKALTAKEHQTVVNVAAPAVNVAAPAVSVAAPQVNVTAQAGETIVQLIEAKSKKVRLKVNRNASGFIESLDVETVTE